MIVVGVVVVVVVSILVKIVGVLWINLRNMQLFGLLILTVSGN